MNSRSLPVSLTTAPEDAPIRPDTKREKSPRRLPFSMKGIVGTTGLRPADGDRKIVGELVWGFKE
jgi:hypothetical protein